MSSSSFPKMSTWGRGQHGTRPPDGDTPPTPTNPPPTPPAAQALPLLPPPSHRTSTTGTWRPRPLKKLRPPGSPAYTNPAP